MIAPEVISMILNHSKKGVTWVYNRAEYDDVKRDALTRWAATLVSIVRGGEMIDFPAIAI